MANNDEMKKAMPNEDSAFTVAFITMKSTPEMTREPCYLNSIDSYIEMMEKSVKTGHAQLEQFGKSELKHRNV